MSKLHFFFSKTQKDIIVTVDGGSTPAVGDLAVCFNGDKEAGKFGGDAELALASAKRFADSGTAPLAALLQGGALNNDLSGHDYELIYTA